MTTDELKAYLELSEKATAGPWANNTFMVVATSLPRGMYGGLEICHTGIVPNRDCEEKENNADFIATSRTIGPAAARLALRAVELLRDWCDGRRGDDLDERCRAFLAELEAKP